MNLQSQLVVGSLLLLLIAWILRNFVRGRLGSGQVLFWLTLLIGAEVFAVFPRLIDRISVLWGNLVPVSWISFLGLLSLIFYLLSQAIQINKLDSRCTQLARTIALLEQRVRNEESRSGTEAQVPS